MKAIELKPVYDRSRVVTDWKCPRARYWNYEYLGKGIVKSSMALELFLGTSIHDCLAYIANCTKEGVAPDIETLCRKVWEQVANSLIEANKGQEEASEFAKEQATLIDGLIRGYYKHVWPRLMEQYPKVLFVEHEMEYEHDGLIFMSKPDLVLANDQEAVYIEYKSTSTKKDSWISSWDTAVQLHSTCKAIKATTGVDVGAVIVQGLYKGYESYGKQTSPMCYAYYKRGNPPFVEDIWSYEYKAGLRKFPTWEMEGGVARWVENMPEQLLADQYPQTPPIYLNEELVETFFRQRAVREGEIKEARELHALDAYVNFTEESVMDMYFPQKFDQCKPAWGHECDFRKLCHGAVKDPLAEGFEFRVPHHVKELEQQNGLVQEESA